MNNSGVFVSWSGGKDCCQAAFRAQQEGYHLRYLLNTVTQDAERSCSHGIAAKWVKLQAEALDIPILQVRTASDNYEAMFVAALRDLKKQGIETGIFGDIDFMPHLEWIEKTCAQAGVKAILPLWQKDQEQIARDFIEAGFHSVVVAAQADLLGPEWLGREFDRGFLRDINTFNPKITACGEAGEFHTLVIDGPLFKKRLNIQEATKVKRDNHWFWDIQRCALENKTA